MNDHTIAAPVCKFEEGCHRVVPCEPGCGAASPSVGPSALCVAEALEHGPVRCPLCPDGLVLHTPDGARAHFTHVHPEQPLVGPGPWPMLGELPVDRAALRDRIAEAALRAVEIAMEDTLLPAAREEALAGIAAVLPAPADRAAVLTEAADEAERVAESLRAHHEFERSTGALDVMSELRRLAGEAAPDNTETPQPNPVLAYGGKGRVWCVKCPRPTGEDVPFAAGAVDPWELCPSCGRHVVDVAEAEGAAPPRDPHPTEADVAAALAILDRFHGRGGTTPEEESRG